MKIKYTTLCEIDVDACDLAEAVANSDAEEQASFFEHLGYSFDSLPVTDKDIQIAYSEKDVRRFLEQMLSWFDYYEKEFDEK